MKSIRLKNGVVLRPIPIAPNDDYMAGSDGNVYSRTQYKGFGRKDYVDWYPLKGHKTKKGYQRKCLRWAIKVGLCSQRHAAKILGMSQGGVYHVVHSKSE